MTIQQPTDLTHAAMLGLGVYRPERVVTNDEICEVLDSSDEWIQTRSGIRTRRFAGEDETLIGMSTAAAERALAAAGVSADQVGCVIVATSTHPEHTPASAPQVATALGLDARPPSTSPPGARASATRSTWRRRWCARAPRQHVLVIGVEQLSRFMDPTDRGTAFIFADGAGAVVVGPADATGIGPTAWGSDGSQAARHHPDPELPRRPRRRSTRWCRWRARRSSAGRRSRWPRSPTRRCASPASTVDELDAFIPHQANLRITQTLSRNIKLPESVAVATDVIDSGNTSAASVPLAMEAMLRKGEAKSGDTALLIAFGAGLSYAGQVVALPPLGQ